MDEAIEGFCADKGLNTVHVMEKLEFVNKHWGMFVAWMRERHPARVKVHVQGGVATLEHEVPGVEVEIIDHD